MNTIKEKMMEKNNKNKIKFFWPWQDQKRANWLSKMSLEGWHLFSIVGLGLVFKFKQGEEREYNYQIDFRKTGKELMTDYLSIFEDSGWEHIALYDGWQYFRKQVENGEGTQIFTDNDSIIQKYKRLRTSYSIIFPSVLLIFLGTLDKYPSWFAILMVSVLITFVVYVGVSFLMITARIKELEE